MGCLKLLFVIFFCHFIYPHFKNKAPALVMFVFWEVKQRTGDAGLKKIHILGGDVDGKLFFRLCLLTSHAHTLKNKFQLVKLFVDKKNNTAYTYTEV